MKKTIIAICLTLGISMTLQPFSSLAEDINTDEPSQALLYHDIVISMLLPRVQKRINKTYTSILTESPDVYPYMVYVKNTERNHFRGFRFTITLKVIPVVGPHISVGADKMTFKINSSKVELTKFDHLKTEELPSHWQHIVK
ncbi:hypothetical protein GCM10008983_17260 [Lentibacillus halophilus]|uniref:DUF3888 domain-containing protein n=1 Tax=Lentibacillus halophilus TaxID=295065 RepID=A0ABN0ZAY8_9BACI